MSPEEQSRVLQGWLEQSPGSPPPSELDAEVVQTVYALRPDLAPAPRVRAEDILDLVTSGPLAGAGARPAPSLEGGAEIVQFPGARAGSAAGVGASESAEAGPRSRWVRWVGGTGGIGLLLVAAATLVVIALPRGDLSEPAAVTSSAPDVSVAAGRSAPPSDVAEAPVDAPLPPTPTAAPGAQAPASPVVLEMQGAATLRQESVIPEVAEGMAQPARASVEEEGVAAAEPAPSGAAAPPPPPSAQRPAAREAAAPAADLGDAFEDLDALRDRVDRSPGTGWRKGVDAAVLARIDLAITEAAAARAAGDRASAAARLERELAPGTPARAGQYLAWLAASDHLAAGRTADAARVARWGLGMSASASAERAALSVVLGDALRAAGDAAGAEAAYREAR